MSDFQWKCPWNTCNHAEAQECYGIKSHKGCGGRFPSQTPEEAAVEITKMSPAEDRRLEQEARGAILRWGYGRFVDKLAEVSTDSVGGLWCAAPAAPSVGEPPGMVTLKERIDELIAKHGTLRASARALEVDAGYLSRLRYGEKDTPGETLLTRMGLRRTELYERLAASPAVPAGVPTDFMVALAFHEAYERLAPSFGYTTRPETRAFDSNSANGKLMIAVIGEIRALLKAGSVHPSAAGAGNAGARNAE